METKEAILTTLSVVAFLFAGTSQAGPAKQAGSTAETHTQEMAQAGTMPSMDVPADAQAASATVERFGQALQKGDLVTVETTLDPDVLILESGGAEHNRQQYLDHHAPADAKFLGDARVQMIHRTARRSGDFAWVGSESKIQTQNGDKPLTLLSTETMILKQVGEDWRIVHIHWSSGPEK